MKASDALATLVQARDIDDPEFSASRTARLQEDVADGLLKLAANGKFSGASPELRRQLEQMLEKGQFKLPSDAGERQELLHDLQDFLDRKGDELSKLRQESSPCEQCRGGT